MKVVALVSGGKDSCFAMMKCVEYGHQIVALANLMPLDDSVDELDSYMYQTVVERRFYKMFAFGIGWFQLSEEKVGHQIVVRYAECMGLPLFRRRIQGSTRHKNLSYRKTQGDEVEDMYILLAEVKKQIPSITAVSSGAIASDYQRLRVESICSRLGLVSLAYLWKRDQSLLLDEMIANGIVAITVKVAAMGLDPAKHLGKELACLTNELHKLEELYGINVCGEGGEYETLTLDCPLFKNAKIVLDDFHVVLHSLDSIAPVGVLHPVAFHLEHKRELTSFIGNNGASDACVNELPSVFEVQEACVTKSEVMRQPFSDIVSVSEDKLQIARTKRDDIFSMACWIPDTCEASEGLQKDLATILNKIDLQLIEEGFGWANVLYAHLYISNMKEFTLANETYISFITEEKCHMGVPSRSTIELPLARAGLGRACIEVLVANDQSKNVLHVQSISCWAPSCIGPYSQATLHKDILYMAGQLGLDPPTMKLCHGGAIAELEQALENCEAVAKSFNCSLASTAISLVVYCSVLLTSSQKTQIQGKLNSFLKQRQSVVDSGSVYKSFDTIVLCVLASDLPKSAMVEVKPTLYVQEDEETESENHTQEPACITIPNYWGFEHLHWYDSCCQKYVFHGKICVVSLSIVNEVAAMICMESLNADVCPRDCKSFSSPTDMKKIARFCIYLLEKSLLESNFSWEDITNLRFYFPVDLGTPSDVLFTIFTEAFDEFSKLSGRRINGKVPMFNLVPVIGAGRSAESMDDLITCELFATKH